MPPPRSATLLALIAAARASAVTVALRSTIPVNHVSPAYVSANLDWNTEDDSYPSWINCSVLAVNFSDPRLLTLASAFAPAHLRIGGSDQDLVWYAVDGPCPPSVNVTFCLTMERWDEINAFAIATGWSIMFGLNAMQGRANATSRFDPTNVEAFLRWTAARRNYTALWGFAFGNELESKVDAAPYAADVLVIRGLIDRYWGDLPRSQRPRLQANDENQPNMGVPGYWTAMLPDAAPAIDVLSWHAYPGYGLDPHLPALAWNATFLGASAQQAGLLLAEAAPFRRRPGVDFEVAVSETAMAWHSGQNGTTNTFLSGPWYISQLGDLAPSHAFQARQTLVGGYYELVDHVAVAPNPDYWTGLLWKRVMGTGVLAATSSSPDVLAWAHCAAAGVSAGKLAAAAGAAAAVAPGPGVAFALINLSPDAPATITFGGLGGAAATLPRLEYALTPASGARDARSVLLNGAPLAFAGGHLSPTPPLVVSDPRAPPFVLQPQSYAFVAFPNAQSDC